MTPKQLLFYSVYFSLWIQLITGMVQIHGILIEIDKGDFVLKEILILETIVQFIEAVFYVYIAFALTGINISSVTPRRYFDWVITTPVMLITTILFMEYDKKESFSNKEDDTEKEDLRLMSFVNENKEDIIKIVVFNFFMLMFGYLGEINVINKFIGIPIGFVFFFLSFEIIYRRYAFTQKTTRTNKILFIFLISIWSLYGVAAMFPTLEKNLGYNVLDILSKNFYGLYIYYRILKLKNYL